MRPTRLVGGVSTIEGRLSICPSGTCVNVCDDYFDYIDAGIVCNSLGLGLVLLSIGLIILCKIIHLLCKYVRCV